MKETDKLRYHSLYQYNELCRDENRRNILKFVAMVMLAAAVVAVIIFLSGCGGGSPAAPPAALPVVAPMKKPAPPPPPPPPPVRLPATYSMLILNLLPTATASQAEAINVNGTMVGYGIVNGEAEATEWQENGAATDLGPGFALAINQDQLIAGYRNDAVTGNPIATLWNGGSAYIDTTTLPLLAGYDSSEATGIDEDGTMVGMCFNLENPSQQQAVKWQHHKVIPIPSLQTALAIHKGITAGIAWNGDAATDRKDLGLQGIASDLNDTAVVGYSINGSEAFEYLNGIDLLGTNGTVLSTATGIASQGIVVGQTGVGAFGSERLSQRGLWRSRVAAVFAGTTRAMAWTGTDGMIDLNTRVQPALSYTAVYATGINDSGHIVGAAVNNETGQTVGFLLEAQ